MYQAVTLTKPCDVVKLFLTSLGDREMPFAFSKKSMVYEGNQNFLADIRWLTWAYFCNIEDGEA